MTLNGVMAVLLHYSAEFGSFGAIYVKVFQDRPILSATKCSPNNLLFSNVTEN